MKNQYFGDINDYKKYGLLRILSGDGEIRTAICWMLTETDTSTDGQFIDYFQKPVKWRSFDPLLFDKLKRCMETLGNRGVHWVETMNIITSAVFYRELITDNTLERQRYFQQFRSIAQGSDLVFFDPDNGLEVKSRPYGRKNSCKYLYWQELLSTFRNGHSILLYQHFRREKREEFIKNLSEEVCVRISVSEVITFRTANVLFLLIPQSCHLSYFRERAEEVKRVWTSQIKVTYYL